MLKHIIGWCLVSIPFIGTIGTVMYTSGWKITLIACFATLFIVLCIIGGMSLIDSP